MRTFLLIFLIMFSSATIQAQEVNEMDDDKVYRFVQKKAEPKQGMSKFLQAFTGQFNSLVIPPKFDEISFKLKFVIEKNGTLSNIEIEENEHAYAYVEEIVRVLKLMPAWQPAENKGKIVRSVHVIPVKLRFPLRSVDKALLDKAILERTVSTEYFEFECNCKLINSNTNQYNKVKEFAYNTADNNVFYSINLKEILLSNTANHFDLIKADAEKQKATINEVDYKTHKALESNFVVNGSESVFYNNVLYFIAGNYLITITVISTNEQISKFNFADLKQTFKLKL
ncbi:hypothetical protein SAMN05421741_101147 [Paenimyroides ummariense]|uniref:TonB protein C-terminal n=1 Tax=Paenimyroides ummariense TaxID=913024 RepID=A0A1I4WBY0_9FLAO|nr:hypothetical protein [Paenimyroides ummariense]SFN10750.1 hypothetical protein SAMN05421741_101147 [Paenimyroides ummariense]